MKRLPYCFSAALAAAFLLTAQASAHGWYSSKRDPVFGWSCCGGEDCNVMALDPGVITPTSEGYRIRLTLEQSRRINPHSLAPIDALVPWSRVQPSNTSEWKICIAIDKRTPPFGGIYCFFEPAGT